jgi:hypothetical protein
VAKYYIGENDAAGGQIAIIDLSLVPTEVVHVVVAFTARMIFESLQRYRKAMEIVLPTVLVMEEAHTFINAIKMILKATMWDGLLSNI